MRSKHSVTEQMMADLHRSSDGGLEVRNPHALQLADSVNSEFFAPVCNTLITSRETEHLVRTCYLPSVRQNLTAFDWDNIGGGTAATNVLPERLSRIIADPTFLKARYEFRNHHHFPYSLTPRLWRCHRCRLSQIGNRRDRNGHLSPI